MISSTLVFILSKVTVTVKDLAFRLYFNTPSMPVRIDLILSCGSPQPPLGRLGTHNLTVTPAAAATACLGPDSRRRLAIIRNKVIFTNFMGSSF
jgi:hypothetical protein